MDLQLENVPNAYREFITNLPTNQSTRMFYRKADASGCFGEQEYEIYSMEMLLRNNPYDKKSPPNYQWLSYADLEFKPLEGALEDITLELIRQAFCFGWVDCGHIFFHPKNHSIWEIYSDLYVRKIAEDFENFIKNAKTLNA